MAGRARDRGRTSTATFIGAGIAARLVVDHPERVDGLILASGRLFTRDVRANLQVELSMLVAGPHASQLEVLPGYARELNPDEDIWHYFEAGQVSNR